MTIKGMLRRAGIYACRTTRTPVGVDVRTDLARLNLSPRVIFDVGANRGQTARKFAGLWPDAEIHSFEPFPAAFADLSRAASDNPRIRAVPMACGSRAGELDVPESPGSETNSLVPLLSSGAATVKISVTTVDEYSREAGVDRIDLLKTDTEGYELEVIAGASAMLGRVRAVLAEVDFDRADPRHVHFGDVMAALEPHGFRFVALYDACLKPDGWDFGNALFYHP